MHRVNVYNYVLDSLDNILKNGIEYYDGKDSEIYEKLLMFSKFIKDNSSIQEKTVIKEKVKCNNIPDSVQILVRDYLDKVCKINIDVLNNKKEITNTTIIENNNQEKKELIEESIDISVNNEYNTINEKKEQIVPSRKSVLLDLFKW